MAEAGYLRKQFEKKRSAGLAKMNEIQARWVRVDANDSETRACDFASAAAAFRYLALPLVADPIAPRIHPNTMPLPAG